ncbi:MAG: anti-sigma factor [Hydrogenophaga sp.]|nr:anti-sigma factor [Hydrogenophaga sp.]
MKTDSTSTVTDAELHAWVDGQLPADRADAVSAWLLHHPDDARRVQEWQAQRTALQGLLRGVLDEPVPLALARATRPPRRAVWPQALAASVLLALGFAGGWWGHTARDPAARLAAATPGFVQEARVAHAVYTPEKRHPVEVGAAEQAHLVQWLSKRLGTPLTAPLLQEQGFSLIGGRLLPGQNSEARALFMYESAAGERITLHVSALGEQAGQDSAFRFYRVGETETFYWVDRHMGYALSGNLPRERLAVLADAAYRQLPR